MDAQKIPPEDDPAIAAAFLDRFLADREQGEPQTLADYQALFPGHEEQIAREYAALRESDGLEDKDGAEQIAHYALLGELGRGGQGVVYRAKDRKLGRLVALKVLNSGEFSQQLLRRFQREARVASRLDHPGICGVLEAGVADGRTFIAMRLVEGRTLAQEIGSGAAPVRREDFERGAGILGQACRAAHAAHEVGVLHRDLKPANIMVTPDDRAVLLDFGLARDSASESLELTQTGDVFGTPSYMAPEQIRGEASQIDRRTDVYALGAALYESLTGVPPFSSATREGLYRAILEGEASSARLRNPQVPRDLTLICSTALEKDPRRRYADAAAMAEDLERFVRREPIRARPVPWSARSLRWVERNRAVAGLTLALFAVLLASIVVLYRNNELLREERDYALAGRLSERQQQVRDLVQVGFEKMFGADSRGADVLFEQALALDPRDSSALVGRYFFDVERPDRALAVLDRFGAEFADQRDIEWMRGMMHRQLGAESAAAASFAAAGERGSHVRSYLEGLRAVEGFQSRDPEAATAALTLFTDAVLRAPRPEFHRFHSLLMCAAYAGDRKRMVEAADLLEHHWPDEPATHDAIAQFFLAIDPERAGASLRRHWELEPNAGTAVGLSALAQQEGRRDEALGWAERAVQMDPDWFAGYYQRASLRKGGDPEGARADLQRCLELESGHLFAIRELAAMLRAAGDAAAVEELFARSEEALADRPGLLEQLRQLRSRNR